MSTDLVAFLKARLDEWEIAAHRQAADERVFELQRDLGHVDAVYVPPLVAFPGGRPESALALIESTRKIIDEHAPVVVAVEWWDAPKVGDAAVCSSCANREPNEWDLPGGYAVKPEGWVSPYVLAPCPTLLLLAEPFADHPDYQTTWRPQ